MLYTKTSLHAVLEKKIYSFAVWHCMCLILKVISFLCFSLSIELS